MLKNPDILKPANDIASFKIFPIADEEIPLYGLFNAINTDLSERFDEVRSIYSLRVIPGSSKSLLCFGTVTSKPSRWVSFLIQKRDNFIPLLPGKNVTISVVKDNFCSVSEC